MSAPQTITISNPASVSFNITNIAASGTFSQTNDCEASLAAGAHCAITVTFSPNGTGLESGTILLSDSTKTSPATIPLSGSGVNGPALTADPHHGRSSHRKLWAPAALPRRSCWSTAETPG